jgi:hypothetical protein
LLDPAFDPMLTSHYRQGVRFEVNGRVLERRGQSTAELAAIEVRLARKRKSCAIGYLLREPLPLPEEQRGVAVSTLGKIIKRGWDWLGVTPSTPERIGGLIEVPALAECLTLNKADFIRTGPRGATYLAYRKAIQEAVTRQLALWGDARDATEETRRRVARPVERDLERVLIDLADEFPLLAALVERREGGQRRLPIARPGEPVDAHGVVLAAVATAREVTASAVATLAAEPSTEAAPSPEEPERRLPEAPPEELTLPRPPGPRRAMRYGLNIQFESRPHDAELGRLIESTVWVNEAHPAFRRAAASRSEGYHLALTVAMALAPLAVDATHEHAFIMAFLERWGSALETDSKRPRRR